MRYRGLLLAVVVAAPLAGCAWNPMDAFSNAPSPQASAPPPPPVAQDAARPPAFAVDRLVGNWGVASYREEKDRARTEAQARSQCKLPYKIVKGPTDGVMMHVADDTTIHELTLKGGPDGKTYLGFAGPPGDDQDREILTFTDKMFIARYINAETNSRYGTFIYVRCGAARA